MLYTRLLYLFLLSFFILPQKGDAQDTVQNADAAKSKPQDHSNEKSNTKFGKVSPADFDLSAYKYDSGASAVVMADIGESHMDRDAAIIFTHTRRVKILDKGGYDAAKEKIELYSGGSSPENLEDLKATTYNLENGKVVESKLDNKSVFTDRISKSWTEKKFSFPAVKEGSIIEYSYTTHSDYIRNFQPWAFQGEYPCLWSEYIATIPDYYHYVQLLQGYQPFYIRKSNDVYSNGNATEYRLVMKDVPPLKQESFTTTLRNHIAKIEFQLSYYAFPGNPTHDVMGNWNTLSEKLMASEYFGAAITKNNGWMDEEVKIITKGANSPTEKAQKIFAYVRDNFTCTAQRGFEAETPLKTVFKNKNGTAPEINLLLIAMLSHVNINADPVILGTREHGYTNPAFPLITRFNYVICRAAIDTTVYYLDASQPWIGFGHLPAYCYNGHARVINSVYPGPVYFEADSLKEQKTTLVFIGNEENAQITGTFQSVPGYIESSLIRESVHKKGEKDYFKDIQASYPSEIVISNPAIDSLKKPEEPVKVSYDFSYKPAAEDGLIYFNPMLNEGYKINPFKSAERKYPVEMPYTRDETYILNMAVPEGYVVDEIPQSAKVVFNDTDGYFEYLVVSDGRNIQLRSHLKLNKANFKPEDYETLRDFYAIVVKKQNEQIVFKKKN